MALISRIRSILVEKKLDAVIVTSEENTSYLTGIIGFEGVVFITKTEKAYCFTDSRYIEIAERKAGKHGYIALTADKNDYFKAIGEICSEHNLVHIGYEEQKVSVALYERIKKSVKCRFMGLSSDFLGVRAIKTQWETDNIIDAQRIAEQSLDALLGEIKPGMTENECKARLEYLMTVKGSQKTSFPTILISGKKTSMPHGTPDNKVIESGDFITFDFGAVVNGYCSDMTRTVAVGSATDEMKKVYNIVLEAQLAGIDSAAAGKSGSEVDKAARDIIEKAGYGEYFGHSLGHGVGIEIHEEPRVSPLSHNVLKEGNVITVEPGIYIPGHFGVRIEDMLYITQNGSKNLTNYRKNLVIL